MNKQAIDKAQAELNRAYFAFAADPANKAKAARYDAARDALVAALTARHTYLDSEGADHA